MPNVVVAQIGLHFVHEIVDRERRKARVPSGSRQASETRDLLRCSAADASARRGASFRTSRLAGHRRQMPRDHLAEMPVIDPAVGEEIGEQRAVPGDDIRRHVVVTFDNAFQPIVSGRLDGMFVIRRADGQKINQPLFVAAPLPVWAVNSPGPSTPRSVSARQPMCR